MSLSLMYFTWGFLLVSSLCEELNNLTYIITFFIKNISKYHTISVVMLHIFIKTIMSKTHTIKQSWRFYLLFFISFLMIF